MHATSAASASPEVAAASLSGVATKLGDLVQDVVCTTQIVSSGLMYKSSGKRAVEYLAENPQQLKNMPNATIERPYMLVPGWTTNPEKFDALVEKLTVNGTNGGAAYYVNNGTIYADSALTKPVTGPVPDAKVFVAVFDNNHQDPSLTAPQLKRSIEAVRTSTGSEKVDLEGYSMGGLATRLFLDQDGEGVGKVLLLGTPNKGTRFAELCKRVVSRDIKFAMNLAGVGAIDLPAFDWLAGAHNAKLDDLNTRFPQQVAKTEKLMILGGKGLPTPGPLKQPIRKGDGMVAAKSLRMPGVETKLLAGRPSLHHGSLPSDGGVYMETANFFGWSLQK